MCWLDESLPAAKNLKKVQSRGAEEQRGGKKRRQFSASLSAKPLMIAKGGKQDADPVRRTKTKGQGEGGDDCRHVGRVANAGASCFTIIKRINRKEDKGNYRMSGINKGGGEQRGEKRPGRRNADL